MYIHKLNDLIIYTMLSSAVHADPKPIDQLLADHPWMLKFHSSPLRIDPGHLALLGRLSRHTNSDKVTDRRHFYGSIIANPNGFADVLRFHTPEGNVVTVGLDERSLCQKNYFTDGEAIHVIARNIQGRYTADLVGDEKTFAVAGCLEDPADKRRILASYLSLSPIEKKAVSRFFESESFACQFLSFLSYAAFTDQDLAIGGALSSVIEEYLILFDSCDDPDSGDYNDLFPALLHVTDLDHSDDSPLLVFLKTYAAANRICPDNDLSPVQTLLCSCPEKQLYLAALALEKLCSPERFSAVINEICRLCSPGIQDPPGQAEQFLCCLLESTATFSRLDLELIADSLFYDKICVRYMNAIGACLSGPNGDSLEQYLSYRFRKGLLQDKMEFYFGAAAVYLIRCYQSYCKPLEQAQKQILYSKTPEDRILGLLALNLGLWYRRNQHQPIDFHASPELLHNIKLWLKDCSKKMYYAVLCAAEELILNDCIDAADLGGFEIRLRLADHLTKPNYRSRAQHLLALLPFDRSGFAGRQLLCKDYLDRYGSASLDDSVVLFGVCANLNCWNLLAEGIFVEEFLRLCHSIRREPEKVSDQTLLFLEKIRRNMMSRLFPCVDTDSNSAAMLFAPLNKSTQEYLSHRCANSTPAVITTPGEAAAIIAYLDTICAQTDPNYSTANFGNAGILITATDFAAENCGSALITKWFYHLCRFGASEKAIAFYDTHQKLLDRPYCFTHTSVPRYNSQINSFLRFLAKRTRLAEGLCIAIRAGQTQVVHDFLHSKFRRPVIRPGLVRGMASGLTRSQRACMGKLYEGVYDPDTFLDRPAPDLDPPDPECMLWYDDRGVLMQYLAQQPDTHDAVFAYNYRGDHQMAMCALRCRGKTLALLNNYLRRDFTLCRLAIQNDPAALSYVDDTIFRQSNRIKPLLLDKAFSLEHLPERCRNDKHFVLPAVTHDGRELRFASAQLRADRQVVLAAISQSFPDAAKYCDLPIQWAAPEFSDDEELILTAAKYNPLSVHFASPKLLESPAIRLILASIDEKEDETD